MSDLTSAAKQAASTMSNAAQATAQAELARGQATAREHPLYPFLAGVGVTLLVVALAWVLL